MTCCSDEFGSGGGAGGAGKLTRDILDAERSAAESKKPTAEEPKKRSGIRMGRIKKVRVACELGCLVLPAVAWCGVRRGT